jgi:hypothetical protein
LLLILEVRFDDVGAHPDEVDVLEVAAGGVALHLPGEGERVTAVELQRDERVRTAGERVGELAGRDLDRQRLGAEAVDDRRHRPGAAEPADRS